MRKVSGPLTTEKVLIQRKFLIKIEQNLYSNTKNFEISRQQSKNELKRYLQISSLYTRRLSSVYCKQISYNQSMEE